MNILAAMSGGVDSAVMAHILSSAGHNVWGVHMILNDETSCDIKTRSCCSTKDSNDAREVAQSLGIYFDAIPMQSAFKKAVVDNFVSEYQAGRTPIPCTLCNGYLKFRLLFDYAESAGFNYVATGHYARVDSELALITPMISDDGTVSKKDQTYYLWQIPADRIPNILFPVGEAFHNKSDVREYANSNSIIVAQKPDSQNICFIPTGDYRKYLAESRPDIFSPRAGAIVDINGDKIGDHLGYWNFSVGQRARIAGLPVAKYVTNIDPETNTITVGDKDQGLSSAVELRDMNFHASLTNASELWIRVNANSPLYQISSFSVSNKACQIYLTDNIRVTKGQAGVIYGKMNNGKIAMLAGGWIN
jgi:tRNA-specific 2-thiouridylase